jgi:hypothetical protein
VVVTNRHSLAANRSPRTIDLRRMLKNAPPMSP